MNKWFYIKYILEGRWALSSSSFFYINPKSKNNQIHLILAHFKWI